MSLHQSRLPLKVAPLSEDSEAWHFAATMRSHFFFQVAVLSERVSATISTEHPPSNKRKYGQNQTDTDTFLHKGKGNDQSDYREIGERLPPSKWK